MDPRVNQIGYRLLASEIKRTEKRPDPPVPAAGGRGVVLLEAAGAGARHQAVVAFLWTFLSRGKVYSPGAEREHREGPPRGKAYFFKVKAFYENLYGNPSQPLSPETHPVTSHGRACRETSPPSSQSVGGAALADGPT